MLEDLAGNVLGGRMGNQGAGNSIIATVLQLLSNYPGGIAGLLQKFQNNGLGDIVASWIGTGQNLPISPTQLQAVLGTHMLGQLAAKLGMSPEAATAQLAHLLPGLVDKLTPTGKLRPGGLISQGLNLLQGFIKK